MQCFLPYSVVLIPDQFHTFSNIPWYEKYKISRLNCQNFDTPLVHPFRWYTSIYQHGENPSQRACTGQGTACICSITKGAEAASANSFANVEAHVHFFDPSKTHISPALAAIGVEKKHGLYKTHRELFRGFFCEFRRLYSSLWKMQCDYWKWLMRFGISTIGIYRNWM